LAYSEEVAQRVRSILDEVPGLVEKKMFGGVSYIVNGNMACGVIGEQLIVRMSQDEYTDALTHPHAHVFDMTGRAMKGWVSIDSAGIEKENELRAWVERGLHFAQGLPSK
jgi:TfoX/Sxy family transcriptional regulator of competence genes